MTEKIYFETLKSVLGRSISHYSFVNFFLGGKDNSELFLDNRRVLKIVEGKKYWKKLLRKSKVEGQRNSN